MTQQDFIKLWCNTVRDGRRRHYRDMTPAEEAAAYADDARMAKRLWRKHGLVDASDAVIEHALQHILESA
jgi:hypothetical protein